MYFENMKGKGPKLNDVDIIINKIQDYKKGLELFEVDLNKIHKKEREDFENLRLQRFKKSDIKSDLEEKFIEA